MKKLKKKKKEIPVQMLEGTLRVPFKMSYNKDIIRLKREVIGEFPTKFKRNIILTLPRNNISSMQFEEGTQNPQTKTK